MLQKKPLTPAHIASKIKVMKKAYFRSIGSNTLDIPNCVRPFLEQMNKICCTNGLEQGNCYDSYAQPLDEVLTDCEKVKIIIKFVTEFVICSNLPFSH